MITVRKVSGVWMATVDGAFPVALPQHESLADVMAELTTIFPGVWVSHVDESYTGNGFNLTL